MTSDTQLDPLSLDGLGGDYWDHARREYLSGVKATTVCQRYGMSLSSFRAHARAGGWRRMDQPEAEVPPEFGEYHRDDDVSFIDLTEEAFLNLRRAMGAGRAAEASTWIRLYDNLADRARAEIMEASADRTPSLSDSRREPLRLSAEEDVNINDLNGLWKRSDIAPQDLDALDSVSPESNSAS